MKAECRRGEIWLVDFNPSRGGEQAGIRPALILQNDIGNHYSTTTIVAAITTTIRPYPVTVLLDRGEGGLKHPSMVNLAQILTLDKDRLIRCLGVLPPEKMTAVEDAIHVSLGVPDR